MGGEWCDVRRLPALPFINAAVHMSFEAPISIGSLDGLQQGKRWPSVEHAHLTDIFQREPHLLAVRCGCDVRAERGTRPTI